MKEDERSVEKIGNSRSSRAQKTKGTGVTEKSVGIVLISLTIVLGFAEYARAALIDNGDGTIMDDDLGIMWLQASNDSPMTWSDPVAWADLNGFGFGTVSRRNVVVEGFALSFENLSSPEPRWTLHI